MERKEYPLLYFDLKENTVLGVLVGTEYQSVDKDLKTLKNTMGNYLKGQYKKHDIYPYMDIVTPKLKVVEVSIRPAYKDDGGSYPLSHTLNVPIPVVYGENDRGYYECYLPLFNESFYYYDAKQFESLVQHFSTNLLNQLPPEQIYRYLIYKEPKLDTVTLRVKPNRDFDWKGFQYQRQFTTLSRLAEKFPFPKQVRKAMSQFPEAAWELEDKVSEVLDKLISTRSNVLIVGPHGVGKSAVLTQAIKKITAQAKKQKLDFSFWRINPQRITASSKYLGEWEETCEALVEELIAANGILWVVNIIQLLQTGGEGAEDSVAAFLLNFLQHNKLQMIGEATPQELESMRRLLPGFVQTFQIVRLEELPEKKVLAIMERFAAFSKSNLKVAISRDAIQQAYRLLLRYYPYESFPGKAIKLLGQAVSEAQLAEKTQINKRVIIQNFIQQTGLPELFLRDDLLLDKEDLHRFFNAQIIGQPDAVNKLCSIVKIYKAGLNNPYKPINTLVFAGPTGVGKTASAKALANYFFGKGQKRSPLIRIDMSEFQHPSQITRFIGAGREPGQLVKEIRERPFSVLLLDEVEKADPSIFDALLTVLDEGILVDGYGRITNFRNTIIIMTSNLGASNIKSIGFSQTTSDESNYLSAIDKHFRPEFVNRIDGVVLFNALKKEDVLKITLKELEELKQREGFTKRQLDLHFTDSLVQHLVSIGFDERYGARPLQRAIEQSLVTPMAKWLLDNPKVRARKIAVDFNGEISVDLRGEI